MFNKYLEESLFESVIDLKFVDEVYFLESLRDYCLSPYFGESLLREVSEFFNVDYSEIEYWLNESIYS